MSNHAVAARLRDLFPVIIERWNERMKNALALSGETHHPRFFHNLKEVLEGLAARLADPLATENQPTMPAFPLEGIILECQALQELVLDFLESEGLLHREERSIVLDYLGGIMRMAAMDHSHAQEQQTSRAEHGLRMSEERYRTLFRSIDEGFCLIQVQFNAGGVASDYRFLETNPVFEKHTGLYDAVGKTARELLPSLEEHWFEIYGNVARTGESVRFQNEAKSMDGRWFDVNAFRVGDPENHEVALLFTDITRRKQQEREREQMITVLRSECALLASLFEQAPAFVALLRGRDHVFEMVNPLYLQLVGHRDVIGKTVREALPEVEEQGFIKLIDNVYETGEPFIGSEIPIKLQRREAEPLEERFVNFVYQALHDIDGTISGLFAHGVDVTDQVLARKELHHKAVQLAEADRRKDEFLAMLGHELRNPLGGISNALYLIQHHAQNMPQMRRPLETLSRQTDHLSRLVNDLLDVSRITQGKIVLQREALSLETAVAAALQGLHSDIHAKGLRFRFEASDHPYVFADPLRLEQILTNLLTNAIKYTETGTISVSMSSQSGEAVVRMKDTGVGIDPELLPHIFDLFTQVNATLDRSRGGLGIGLTLVKRLVEMHGGRVEAESDGPGQGSRFSVYLPLATETGSHHCSATPGAPLQGRRAKVLVVDDNVDAAETLSEIIDAWGHETVVTHDGLSALEAARAHRPDVVFLDIGLPGLDGYEVARRLRSQARGSFMELVAVTGYGQADDQRRAHEAGFDHHLTKPVDLSRVQTLLARSRGPEPAQD